MAYQRKSKNAHYFESFVDSNLDYTIVVKDERITLLRYGYMVIFSRAFEEIIVINNDPKIEYSRYMHLDTIYEVSISEDVKKLIDKNQDLLDYFEYICFNIAKPFGVKTFKMPKNGCNISYKSFDNFSDAVNSKSKKSKTYWHYVKGSYMGFSLDRVSIDAKQSWLYLVNNDLNELVVYHIMDDDSMYVETVKTLNGLCEYLTKHIDSSIVFMNRGLLYKINRLIDFKCNVYQIECMPDIENIDQCEEVMRSVIKTYNELKSDMGFDSSLFTTSSMIRYMHRDTLEKRKKIVTFIPGYAQNYYRRSSIDYIPNGVQVDMNAMFPSFAIATSNLIRYDSNLCRYPTLDSTYEVREGCVLEDPNVLTLHLYIGKDFNHYVQSDIEKNYVKAEEIESTIIFSEFEYGVYNANSIKRLLCHKNSDNIVMKNLAKRILVCMYNVVCNMNTTYDCHFVHTYTKHFIKDITKDINCMVIVDSIAMSTTDYDIMVAKYPYMFGNNVGNFRVEFDNCQIFIDGIGRYFIVKDNKVVKIRNNIDIGETLKKHGIQNVEYTTDLVTNIAMMLDISKIVDEPLSSDDDFDPESKSDDETDSVLDVESTQIKKTTDDNVDDDNADDDADSKETNSNLEEWDVDFDDLSSNDD